MRKVNPERTRLVVLSASVAALSGVTPVLMRLHKTLGWIWLGLMVLALVYVIVQFPKVLRSEG